MKYLLFRRELWLKFLKKSLLTRLAYLISKQFEYLSNIKWLPNWVRSCYGFHQIQLLIPNSQLEQVPLVFQVSNQASILYKWFIFNLSLKKVHIKDWLIARAEGKIEIDSLASKIELFPKWKQRSGPLWVLSGDSIFILQSLTTSKMRKCQTIVKKILNLLWLLNWNCHQQNGHKEPLLCFYLDCFHLFFLLQSKKKSPLKSGSITQTCSFVTFSLQLGKAMEYFITNNNWEEIARIHRAAMLLTAWTNSNSICLNPIHYELSQY